jgi:hypothetical protein
MSLDLRDIPSVYDPTDKQRDAVMRLVERNVKPEEVQDMTDMLLGMGT